MRSPYRVKTNTQKTFSSSFPIIDFIDSFIFIIFFIGNIYYLSFIAISLLSLMWFTQRAGFPFLECYKFMIIAFWLRDGILMETPPSVIIIHSCYNNYKRSHCYIESCHFLWWFRCRHISKRFEVMLIIFLVGCKFVGIKDQNKRWGIRMIKLFIVGFILFKTSSTSLITMLFIVGCLLFITIPSHKASMQNLLWYEFIVLRWNKCSYHELILIPFLV